MSKSIIAYTDGAEAPKARTYWPTIGSAWKSKKNKDAIAVEIGRKVKDKTTGELKSTLSEVTLQEGSRLYLQPNTRKVAGDKAPDFFVALVTDDESAN